MKRRLPAAPLGSLIVLAFLSVAPPARAQTQGATADFTFLPASPKAGDEVQFTDASSGFIFGWYWSFGDAGTSGDQNPSHVYPVPGVYAVTLTVIDRNLNQLSVTKSVSVSAGGTADFSFEPVAPTVGQSVAFTDRSSPASAWAWDFGDGATSTQQNPTHTYASAGAKTVKLTITASGANGSATKTLTVQASSLNADFAYFPTNPVTNQAVSFQDTSSGSPTGWSWNFGDGATSMDRNPSHAYAAAGTYTVGLTVTGGGGLANSQTKRVTVTAAPTGAFTAKVVRSNEINSDTANGNGIPEPGERATLYVSVSNGTSRTQPAVVGLLVPKTPGITMIVDQVEYGTVAAGASAVPPGVPFEFFADPSVPCAAVLSFDLRLTYGGQPSFPIPLTVKLGSSPCAPPKDTPPSVTVEDGTMTGAAYSVGSSAAVFFTGKGSKSITGYKVELSRDGGASFNETVSDGDAAGVGPHLVAFTVKGPETAHARLRITAKVADGTTVSTGSRGDFTITSGAGGAGVARLPAVVQVAGVQGTFFTTEATIASPDRAAAVSLTFTPTGQLPIVLPKPLVMQRGTRFFPDVFQPFRDQGVLGTETAGVGTLTATVGGVPNPVILARVVNLPATGIGTFGLSFLSSTADAGAFTSEAWVSGLVTNAQFRSNISVAHAGGGSGGPLSLTLELYDGATGQQVSGSPRPIFLAPNGFVQINNFQGFGVTSTGVYLARFTRTSGDDQFRAYGTIIDAITGDASFVDGSAPNPNGAASVHLASIVEASGQFGSFFTSDVTLVNRSATETAKVSLHLDSSQGPFDVANAFTLGPRQAQVVRSVVDYLNDKGAKLSGTVVGPLTATFSSGDGYASVRTASARLNRDPTTGTYGLSFAGRRDAEEAVANVLLVGAKKSTSYRTNLSLVNVGATPITLSYQLVSAAYYQTSKAVDATLAPGAFAQVNDIVGSTPSGGAAGAAGGTPGDYFVLVTRTSGNASWQAYLTILDNVTNDGSFVEMVKR